MQILRTPDERFDLPDFPFTPNYIEWNGMRLHHLDEGPEDGPVFLLMHGEPTWSYLYRNWIPALVARGYRCIAPDHPGFGRSDKPTDKAWYTIERHIEALRHRIEVLDLQRINLVVQDWGGPIGLRQLCDMPERFERVFILNTWLHHAEMEYNDGAKAWRQMALDPNVFGTDIPTGRIVANTGRRDGHDKAAQEVAYDAPFPSVEYKAGPLRFPYCIPMDDPSDVDGDHLRAGNAVDQQRCYDVLQELSLPKHIIFGDADPVFPFDWAEQWHGTLKGSTLDRIPGAGHFVQEDAPEDCLAAIFKYLPNS
jgi:haloalkane dehalogenase